MQLSIIIVNWNSAKYLAKCLESIYDKIRDIVFEVIVVDNASYDGCEEIIRQNYLTVNFMQSHENMGFAKANNLGFLHSSGATVLFLNPDTELLDASLKLLYDQLVARPEAGAVGCNLLNTDMSLDTTSVQPFPTLLNQVIDSEIVWKFMNRLKSAPSNLIKPVEVIPGACIMIKRNVFKMINGFSTDYFMYAEDVDLCYKIYRAGYKIYHLGSARIIHHGGKSSQASSVKAFPIVMTKESIREFFKKYYGALYAVLYTMLMGITAIFRIMMIVFLFPIYRLKGRAEIMRNSFVKWLTILKWSFGYEKWAMELNLKKPTS